MERTKLDRIPCQIPEKIRRYVETAEIYEVSCSPDAKVYFADWGKGWYLKRSGKGTLEKEAKMTDYFYQKGLGPQLLLYQSDEWDWIVTEAVPGEDAASGRYLSDPRRLCDLLAGELRSLHETDAAGCPVPDRTGDYLAGAEESYRTGQYDAAGSPARFGYHSAAEAYKTLQEGKEALKSRVLLHGDYCLPNIILKDWKRSGFIDTGFGGIGDRHIDLFWGIWTLQFNLRTDKYRSRFLDAYGRDAAEEELLRVIAAAEVFG